MLAGLPKAPSAYNPIVNPQARHACASSTSSTACSRTASSPPSSTTRRARRRCATARRPRCRCMPSTSPRRRASWSSAQYGDEAYTRGLNVYLTIDSADQMVAYRALRKGMHGLRAAPGLPRPRGLRRPAGRRRRSSTRASPRRWPTTPTTTSCARPWCSRPRPRKVVAVLQTGETITVTGEGLQAGAPRACPTRPSPKTQIRRGAVIRAGARTPRATGRMTQLPEVEGAFVALDPRTGAIRALVGGFDYAQEQVQPRHAGLAPAGLELQALHLLGRAGEGLHAGHRGQRRAAVLRRRHHRQPAVGAEELRRQVRRARCRCGAALAKSKNMVSIRILQSIGAGLRAGLDHPLRLRRRQAPGLPDDGAGRRLGHAAADGRRPTACSPTAATASTRCLISQRHRHQGPACCTKPSRSRSTKSMRTHRRAQRLRDDQPAAGSDALGHGGRARRAR